MSSRLTVDDSAMLRATIDRYCAECSATIPAGFDFIGLVRYAEVAYIFCSPRCRDEWLAQPSDEQPSPLGLSDLAAAFQTLILDTGRDDDGVRETPARAARAWRELTEGYGTNVADLFTTFDGEGYDEMVALGPIPFTSLCEHHLLPFTGDVSIAYLPSDKIVGLSKLARVTRAYARRLQNQERLTTQIADALVEHADARGVLVWVEAHHSCMSARGACSEGLMRTSATRGAMRDSAATRDEAMRLIGK